MNGLRMFPGPHGWTVEAGSLSLTLELFEGRLYLHDGEVGEPGVLAPAANGDPFGDSVWRSESVLGLAMGTDGRQVLWDVRDVTVVDPAAVVVQLRADNAPLAATLRMTAPLPGVVTLRARVTCSDPGATPVTITAAPLVAVTVPQVDETVHLAGSWAAECQVRRAPASTSLLLESRTGKTGFEYQPYLALLGRGVTRIIALAWSGNWCIRSRPLQDDRTAVTVGLNSWGLRHQIRSDAPLDLPEVTILRADGDLNRATQLLHRVRRADSAGVRRPVPVQFNSWYPRPGEPDLATMRAMIPGAARLGCEVFVLDAGWYANTRSAGEDWWMRTGDWLVANHLFPDGLDGLVGEVRRAGLDFGIWFEPEAVGPASSVHDQGGAWLHDLPNEPHWSAGRRIRHLGVPAAREAVRDQMLAVLGATDAKWMKWDFNTDLLQGGWPAENGSGTDPLIAHCAGLYQLQREILAARPGLVLEMCAGGGGRFDAAVMHNADVTWMSDKTQAVANLAIHLGSQLAHPPEQCNDWLVEWPPHDGHRRTAADLRGDLPFRTHVAMLGSFGVSAPVHEWTGGDLDATAELVAWYKSRHRPLLPVSDQYLLGDDGDLEGRTGSSTVWYASRDGNGGNAFVFQLDAGAGSVEVPLEGLDESQVFDVQLGSDLLISATGQALAGGVAIPVTGAYSSTIAQVRAHRT